MKTEKYCCSCKIIKPKSDFSYGNFNTTNGSRCRPCATKSTNEWRTKNKEKVKLQTKIRYDKNPEKGRERTRKCMEKIKKNNPEKYAVLIRKTNLQKFGLTIEEYEEMIKNQNNLCAICNKPENTIHPQTKNIKRLAIDHCHKTNKVRGLLCGRCNPMIGYAQNSIEILKLAIQYLIKNG
jgi:hypothetical protein